MRYKHSAKGKRHRHHASCARFCANVCSQFGSGRKQCFEDCMACRGERYVRGREATHGCISRCSDDAALKIQPCREATHGCISCNAEDCY